MEAASEFRVLQGTSKSAVITPDETGGEHDERSMLAKHLEPDFIYLADRGCERYSLLGLFVRTGSHYVIRCQERPVDVLEERELSQAACVDLRNFFVGRAAEKNLPMYSSRSA